MKKIHKLQITHKGKPIYTEMQTIDPADSNTSPTYFFYFLHFAFLRKYRTGKFYTMRQAQKWLGLETKNPSHLFKNWPSSKLHTKAGHFTQKCKPHLQLTQKQAFYMKKSHKLQICLLYTSPSPRDGATSRMPSSA